MKYSEIKRILEIEGHGNYSGTPIIIENRNDKLVAYGNTLFEKAVAAITFNQLIKLVDDGILIGSNIRDYYIIGVNCTPEMIADSI